MVLNNKKLNAISQSPKWLLQIACFVQPNSLKITFAMILNKEKQQILTVD